MVGWWDGGMVGWWHSGIVARNKIADADAHDAHDMMAMLCSHDGYAMLA